MHSKGGALYDEDMNVPLLIHMPGQMHNVTRAFTCSSVDILPFIYSSALGNESWRTNPNDLVSYLNHRESIFDQIWNNDGDSRRLAPYTNYGGFGNAGGALLPYVLHTTDEYSSARDNSGKFVPSHAIAFRTVDHSVVIYDGNTGMNFYGGGKLGMYTPWLPCTTYPNAASESAPTPQFEFYEYYPPSNNYGEIGNDAFNSAGAWNSLTAGVYVNSYNNIMAQELYRIDPKFNTGFTTAFSAYMNYLNSAGLPGGGTSCAYNDGLLATILPPA